MKRHSFIPILLMICCGNTFSQSDFKFRRKIMDVQKEAWYSISFPPDMFQHLERNMADVRVYKIDDRDTVEIPYLLRIQEDEVQRENVDLKLFNKSSRNGIMYLTFETNPLRKVNFLKLEFDEPNYLGHVTVEGSDDRLTWFEVLKNHRIVSIDKAKEVLEFSTIRFPLSSYRYLRLGITSDVELHFRSASFAYDKIKSGSYHKTPLTWDMKLDRKLKQSTIDIRLKHYMPISKIGLQIGTGGDFYRGFELMYVRDSTRSDERWIKNYEGILDGHLTSFQANEFNFPSKLTKELRVIVRDYDNAPLKIDNISAAGPEVNLVTYVQPGNIFLLYGAEKIGKPIYDLTHFENKIPETPEIASLGQSERIDPEDPGESPLFKNKVWLWSIMGIMIVGLGFFTIKMMRQGPA